MSVLVQAEAAWALATVYSLKHKQIARAIEMLLSAARAAGHLPLGTFDRKVGRLDGAVSPACAED